MLKKMGALCMAALLFAMLLPAAQPVSAATFGDVKNFKQEIQYLTDLKIINGYPDGSYRPEEPILRVQAVMMIMREMGLEMEKIPDPGFSDIRKGDMGYEDVAAASYYELIEGKGSGRFDPKGHMTRGEMSKVLALAYELGGMYPTGFTDVAEGQWTYPYVSALAAHNVTNGYPDGTFRSHVTINREQFTGFMARILNPAFKPYTTAKADSLLENVLDIEMMDVAKHPEQPVFYILDGLTNSLVSFNYETDELDSVELPYRAESLAYAKGKVYVTQHKMNHEYWTGDRKEEGAYAIFDADSLKLIKLWHLALDPYDIEANDEGQVFISGGSNQHTDLTSFDSKTGAILSQQMLYMRAKITLTPNQKNLLVISTAVSPRNLSAFPIVGGLLQLEIRSPYHGVYAMTPDVSVTPDGKYILNGFGNMFSANTMKYLGTLDRPFSAFAVDVASGELHTAFETNLIQSYDYPRLISKDQLVTYGTIHKLFYDEHADELISLTTVRFGKSVYPYLGIETISRGE
ncbi:S-layer homology domain-containing protein [Planococcus sp. ISL-110]|uniref:S-layer homology domain-containing protein n=1 Tax=Planococcus sp. ISL-110 TaxID=2819167 RepID=UPI001BE8D4A9|nr:S-layer homology domain-containing protein [Planococcus sp. ISL-110]MBT2571315.1 S-layer homology domain-containing protein [Planococcus sp. ISL-110]